METPSCAPKRCGDGQGSGEDFMLNRRQPFTFVLGAMMIPLFFLAGCNHQKSPDAAEPSPGDVKVEEIHSDGAVQVEHPDQFQLTTVERRPTVDELHVTGVVTPDINRAVPVLSLGNLCTSSEMRQ
jgi:hypothetical protein